jgi:hypothetical protein
MANGNQPVFSRKNLLKNYCNLTIGCSYTHLMMADTFCVAYELIKCGRKMGNLIEHFL